MTALNDLLRRLDPDPRVRGKQFEHICKWFLTNDPKYKALFRDVWLWKEWPDGWSGTEAGIDLVAEDRDGHRWAIQCKAYAADKAIPKAELNKFLSESNRKEFQHRLLVSTTTGGLHHIAQATVEAQDKPVSIVDLTDLEASPVRWHTDPFDLRPSPPGKPATPYDYQREAIKNVMKGFQAADRGQLIMACGTGKTLTALFIKEKLGAHRTLVLVPSLSLLKQTMRVWYANATVEFDSRPVCSDETVRRDEDAAVAHVSDLGMPVTTDPEQIATFLRKRGPRVVFATYQSSQQIAKAFTLGRVPRFDLVIADEAHRCAGPVSSDFATVLDKTAINAKRRLFMTATPRFFTGRVLREAKEADFEYASMDDHAKFGEVFHRLSFSDAIKRKLLTDYQVAIIGVEDATYRDWAERGALVTLDGKKHTDARSLAGQIGLAKAMRKYGLRRVISFHGRVSRAREFATSTPAVVDWMPAHQRPTGRLWSQFASGEMSAGARHVLLQHLKKLDDGQRGLLANARCLAEGVDVPALDGVAFIDPRRSEVDIVQAVGRAIRKSETKTIGTVVIPVFIDNEEDPEIALDDSVFKPVWDVIKALRAHDDELGRQLDELRRELGRDQRRRLRLPLKIRADLPAGVSTDFARAFDVRLVEQTTVSWEFWFGLLERYVRENGNVLVPAKSRFHDHRLGAWVNEQRSRYMEGALPAERISRLADLKGWTWDARDAMWEDGFLLLKEYIKHKGNSLVPSTYTTANGFKLGQWVSVQRTRYGQGIIAQERQERLAALPGWVWGVGAHLWEEGFRHLEDYIEGHGTALVPLKYTSDDGYQLGAWVNSQKVAYGKGALPNHREQRLRGLHGWSWSAKDTLWRDGFSRLLRYHEVHRHVDVPQNHADADGYHLGSWVAVQRAARNAGRLKPEREARLSALPGWTWDPRAKKWDEGYAHLLRYVETFDDAAVPQAYVDDTGHKLGAWTQRQRNQKDTLNLDRVRKLENLPDWTWAISYVDEWEQTFRQLLHYVERHGDARVPSRYEVKDCRLGAWVAKQRIKRRRGTLDGDHERRLQELTGWIWDA